MTYTLHINVIIIIIRNSFSVSPSDVDTAEDVQSAKTGCPSEVPQSTVTGEEHKQEIL